MSAAEVKLIMVVGAAGFDPVAFKKALVTMYVSLTFTSFASFHLLA